jgi:hypothetical protein
MYGKKTSCIAEHVGELKNIPPSAQPWDLVGVDILKMPKTKKGCEYVLVFMDYLTKWPEVVPLKNISADSVAKAFIAEILCRHGVPKKLLTDQGSQFTSDLMKQVLHQTGTVKLFTTTYHPQTDGMVERFNKTLTEMLVMTAEQHKDDWDVVLPYTLFAYRTAEHASTGNDPFFLTYGRLANFPLQTSIAEISSVPENVEYAQRMVLELEKARENARKCIGKAQEHQKREYDLLHSPTVEYQMGALVMIQNPKVTNDRIPKMEFTWSGPFQVMEMVSSLNYRVRNMKEPSALSKIVHIRHMKLWYDPAQRGMEEGSDLEPLPLPNIQEQIEFEKSLIEKESTLAPSSVQLQGHKGKEEEEHRESPNKEESRDKDFNLSEANSPAWTYVNRKRFPLAVTMADLEPDQEVGEILPGDYEIWGILDQKKFRVRKKDVLHFLIRFKGYGPDSDEWIPKSKLQAPLLLREFQLKWENGNPTEIESLGVDIPPPTEEDLSI